MDFDTDDDEFFKVLEALDNQNDQKTDNVDDDKFLKLLEEMDNPSEVLDDNTTEHEPHPEHLQCLLDKFGHEEFRPSQWQVIRSIIEDKRDNCTIMATGYGKSLCFQFPPVYTNGMSFIISPLISLMQDQVNSLNLKGIKACMLGSAQPNKNIEEDIINGDYRIVYASPEYISGSGSFLIGKLKDKLTLIAVDEAHCISSWGSDFRPMYLQLKTVRNDAPNVPILAVTATASERVQQDICNILKLRDPQIISTGFDRPNLEIVLRPKTKDPWSDIELILRSKVLAGTSCIIYCLTRKATDAICDDLKRHGVNCGSYHAGKSQIQRKDVFDKFVRDEINVIVATVAFGMGIDKSDVRCVIHYGVPADMDSYYQEIGRAGRDGVQSKCVLFYSDADFEVHRFLRNNSRMSDRDKRKAEARAKIMSDFIHTKQCRRLKILQYFDPSATCPKLEICCDNCRTASHSSNTRNNYDHTKEVDFTADARILLNAIKLFDGNSGLAKPISVIRGSKAKSIERFHNNKLLGSGKHKSEQYWKLLADLLEREEFLEKSTLKNVAFTGSVIQINRKGKQWLSSGSPLKLVPPEQLFQVMQSGNVMPPATVTSSTKPLYDTSLNATSRGTLSIDQNSNKTDEELKRNLMLLRATIASREGTMPYKIAVEPAIQRLVEVKPLNLQELRDAKVTGFSEAIIRQFGPEFLECIQRSKGFLPQKSIENMEEKPQCFNVSNGKEDRVISHDSSTPTTSLKVSIDENIQTQSGDHNMSSDYQNVFDDDNDLFMMVDYDTKENSDAQKPCQSKEEPKKQMKISTTVSKRVKYESGSDEDMSPEKTSKRTEVSRPQASFQNNVKPVGIKKRNIF